ncbi:MAG: helicase associated domain-containing protein [Chitinivibrionales bacterium]|nr:helicase associated domain-containing protein [Chitinivibrionales bacterium]
MNSDSDQSVFAPENFPTLSGHKLKRLLQRTYHRKWLENYLRLRLFLKQFGRYPHLREENPKGFAIGSWVNTQKSAFRNGRLPLWRYKLLAAIKISWPRRIESWQEVFNRAIKLQQRKGGPLSKDRNATREEHLLKNWVNNQRVLIRKGGLEKEKVKLLEKSGLLNDKRVFDWNNVYAKVKAFIGENRRLPSPHSANRDEKHLGKWRLLFAGKYRKGKIPEWQAEKIAALGLDRKILDLKWNNKISTIREILESAIKAGKISGKRDFRKSLGKNLYYWLLKQRRNYQKGILEGNRARILRENKLLYNNDWLNQIKP